MKTSIQGPWDPSSTCPRQGQALLHRACRKDTAWHPSQHSQANDLHHAVLAPHRETHSFKWQKCQHLPAYLIGRTPSPRRAEDRSSSPGAYSTSRCSSHKWPHTGTVGVGTTYSEPLLPPPAAVFFLSLPPPVASLPELSAQPPVLGNSSCIWIPWKLFKEKWWLEKNAHNAFVTPWGREAHRVILLHPVQSPQYFNHVNEQQCRLYLSRQSKPQELSSTL